MLSRLLVLAAFVLVLVVPSTASAQVTVDGTGEPEFTSSAQNTQWVKWEADSAYDAYRLRITHNRDGQQLSQQTLDVPKTGSTWIDWAGVASLEEGRTYEICVAGLGSFPNDSLFFTDGPDSCTQGDDAGKRTATTIDRTKPVVSVQLADGAESTTDKQIPLRITYEDGLSSPFPANFLCQAPGSDANAACEGQIYGYSPSCSQPAADALTTSFECMVDANAVDPSLGTFSACVKSADSAVPDNPSSTDQSGAAGSANLSETACDSVKLLDAACEKAKDKLEKAKRKLKALKQSGAVKDKIQKAKAKVKRGKAAVKERCAS